MANNPTTVVPSKSRITLMWVLLLVVLVGFAWSFISYLTTARQLAGLTNSNLANRLSKQQTEQLLGKVSKLMTLPKDRNTIVASITDVETLAATQDFYLQAHNGDKLIIFPASKKAVIYDEDDNRIVNVGPISFNNPETAQKVAAAENRLEIEIRNGTTNSGAGIRVRDQLKTNASFNITALRKAAKTDYSDTIIVDTTGGKKADMVAALQKALGARVVTSIPEGEATPRSEIVIIVGAK